MKNIYCLIAISCIVFSSLLNAQWIRNNGPNGGVHSFAVSDTNLFAGTVGGIIYRSTNNGTSWTAVFNGTGADAIAISDTNIFAGTDGGVYRSTNNGTNWTEVNTGLTGDALKITALFVSDTNLFAGTWGGGVFHSTNNGTSWTAFNTGLTNYVVNALLVSGTNLFAGTNDGVWRRPLSEILTSVDEIANNNFPQNYELKQNYPNPFNPNTKLSYSITQSGFVTLKVYDLLGTEIETLVNEEKPVGTYELTWNAANLPSGVYFYRLQAESFVQTRKMILLK